MNEKRQLTLMRHAKSDWSQPGLDDHDRPLNARGRRSAPLVAAKLEETGLDIDTIICSTATRAQQTLELLKATWQRISPRIRIAESLYLASPAQILNEVAQLGDDCRSAMVIAHNPGMEELASAFAGRHVEFPTACAAVFELAIESWQQLEAPPVCNLGQLCYCFRPRELERGT